MAGILPGVECARRRRFHQTDPYSSVIGTNSSTCRTRRYSFCLYTSSSNDTHPNYSSSTSSSLKRSISNHQKTLEQDEKLEGGVREAKERLREKLRSRSYSSSSSSASLISVPNKRSSTTEGDDIRLVIEGHLEKKAVGSKKKTCSSTTKYSHLSRRTFMSWAKFGWKSSNQEVCAGCNF
ncbi:uncharacterized protein LOC113355928 [Papaver somniferum]|uniref:uncharacterized protein LOC113355928 n=1 Tax=Papaver somniferum TaxID=3469 RepID=UPI000E6F48C5|nr:uncharacterized protein LOC113355928 [Papaver somniferum]